MSQPTKSIPDFASEAAEREFWESSKNDSVEYVDWNKASLVSFPRLLPSAETISSRKTAELHAAS
jgi:CopG antitoxin of type II toxin-antitoxin system